MGFLEADIPHIQKNTQDYTGMIHHFLLLIKKAEDSAVQAQVFNKGDHGVAFQHKHAQFIQAAQNIRHQAGQAVDQISQSSHSFVHTDQENVTNINNTGGVF